MATELKLPELGENIDSGNVVKVLVSVGDKIEQDQPVLELETDKATIEVPSSVTGTVEEIRVKEGSKAKVGEVVLTVKSDGAEARAKAAEKPREKREPAAEQPAVAGEEAAAQKPKTADRRKRSGKRAVEEPLPEEQSSNEPLIERTEDQRSGPGATIQPAEIQSEQAGPAAEPVAKPSETRLIAASPSIRRLAREIGIDIADVPGSGPAGRISIEDVKEYARELNRGRRVSGARSAAPPLPAFEKWGAIDRKPMTNIRLKTAEHLATAWANVPQVTQFDKADTTELEIHRKRFSEKVEASGGKLTMTSILLKVVASALRVFPQFNASIDTTRNEIIYKKYYHVGIAVDTERGLLVPVIRDVDKKNIIQLSVELNQVSAKARNKKLTLEEMQGGTFTITNLGGIGGTYFSPIVNYPEVAILGISRSATEPVYVNEHFQPRTMLPLSLSYDHRLIDGADAARFLRWIVEALKDPFLIALEG